MANNHDNHGDTHTVHHVTPMHVYTRVFVALIIGTILTVAASYVNFGTMNVLIAMVIATVKALLVILFFMGLKYEGQENNVTFFLSFVFLAIFVGMTSSDLFFRTEAAPVAVDASELAASSEPVDVQKLVKGSPELTAKGKAIFLAQCVTCHGSDGKGDGPASAALTPKPRNFTSDQGWKFGRALTTIFHTVTNGSPGTPMPPFSGMSPEDRFAVAHYIQTLFTSPAPADKPEDVAAVSKLLAAGGKPHMSVERALDKVAEEWEAAHPAGK